MPETVEQNELVEQSENVIWVGGTGFEAYGDHFIAVVDEFLSGSECPTCKGKELRNFGGTSEFTKSIKTVIPCKECNGKGKRQKVGNAEIEVKCSACEGSGEIVCPDCKGTGTSGAGALATPEEHKGRPTTGTIVSIGPRANDNLIEQGMKAIVQLEFHNFIMNRKADKWACSCGVEFSPIHDEAVLMHGQHVAEIRDKLMSQTFKLGDRVMFSSYAGHEHEITAKTKEGEKKKVFVRFIREQDIICRVYGQLLSKSLRAAKALHTSE